MGQPSRQGSALFSVRLELWRSTAIVGVHGHHGIPFKLDDIVDVRLM
jgi:hypothetical protein